MKNLNKINKRNEILTSALEKVTLAKHIKCGNLKPYLFQYLGKESTADYERRLSESYFFNKIDNVINNYVSKPFKKDFRISDKENDVTPEAKALTENFDGKGTNVTDFLKLILKESFYYSQSHVFTDMVEVNGEFSHTVNIIELQDFLDFEFNKVGELTYLRFRTEEHVRVDYEIKKYLVIKEFFKIGNEVFWNDYISTSFFTKVTQKDGLSFKERQVGQSFGLDYIPLRSYYLVPTMNKFNPDIIFQNAFELQLSQFKTSSRLKYNELIYSTASRVLKTGNVDDNEGRTLQINPKSMTILDINDELAWDVPPYQILEAYRKEISSMNGEIDEIMGNILYGKTNGSSTATENILMSSSTNNFLSAISNSLQWFAENVINDIKEFTNMINAEFQTSIITDYSVGLSQVEVQTLFQLYSIGGIAKEDLFEEMKRRNVFDDYLTFNETMAKLLNEQAMDAGITNVGQQDEIVNKDVVVDESINGNILDTGL